MDADTLYDAIVEVCPIISATCPNPDIRETWTYVAKAEAIASEIAAANNVIATIPVETKPAALPTADFIGRFTNAEYRAATATAWRQTAGNAKNWDVVVFEPTINLNKKKVATLKTSLVTDGILTAARADAIFDTPA